MADDYRVAITLGGQFSDANKVLQSRLQSMYDSVTGSTTRVFEVAMICRRSERDEHRWTVYPATDNYVSVREERKFDETELRSPGDVWGEYVSCFVKALFEDIDQESADRESDEQPSTP